MHDALVVGGGPAGSAAALVLAREGWDVVLVEAEPAAFRIGESLPPAARPLLRDLGVLDALGPSVALRATGTSAAWGSATPRDVDFVRDPQGQGWHIDRARFDALLREAARAAGAEVREGLKPSSSDLSGARALVDASGRRATVARARGARRLRLDRLVAVYARLAAAPGDVDARTLVEATPDGWWYTALVPGDRRIAAFLTDADLLPAPLRTAAGFAAALESTEHVAARAGPIEAGPHVAPAHSARLDPPCAPGPGPAPGSAPAWLAVGDAALAFDPLSSQGITTALHTGLRGAEALSGWLRDGDPAPLAGYAERIEAIAATYGAARADYYAVERRWPGAPFWDRRRAAAVRA